MLRAYLSTSLKTIHIFITLYLISSMTACGGAAVPSPELYNRILHSKTTFEGDMEIPKANTTSAYQETFTQATLGRTIQLSDAKAKAKLEPIVACAQLLPDRIRDDYRDRLPTTFDSYLLSTLNPNQENISFDQINWTTALDKKAAVGSVISAHVGISRILRFVDEKELKHFDRCCKLTGSCGNLMVSELYEANLDIHYINRGQPTLVSSMLNFEKSTNSSLKTVNLTRLIKRVYFEQVKAKKTKPTPVITHFKYRQIPSGQDSPFIKSSLSVSPVQAKVRCKKKKNKKSSVVEFNLQLNQVESAQETLGYEITTSKQWVDLSLAERKRLVQVGSGVIACYPGPEAFTNPDDRCPSSLILTAFPPACPDLKGDGQFEWKVKFGVYAPGDDKKRVHHQSDSNVVITKVHRR